MGKVIDDEEVLTSWYDSRTEFVVSFDTDAVDVDLSKVEDGEVVFFIKGTRNVFDKKKFKEELKDILKYKEFVYLDELKDVIDELEKRKVKGTFIMLMDCLDELGIKMKERKGDKKEDE